MHLIKSRTTLITIYLALLCAFVCGGSMRTFAETGDPTVEGKPVRTQSGGPMFVPPNLGIPRQIDGTRGQCIAPLLPINNPIGLTIAEYPTFFVFVDKTGVQTAEFTLEDENNAQIYATSFTITGTSGIISLSLPASATLPPLEIGKNYNWKFSLNCKPADTNGQVIVASGWIRRVEASPTLIMQLQKATGRDRVAIYAAQGMWYDALTSLAIERRANPNDPVLVSDWDNLLMQVGLNDYASKPLIQP